MPDENRFAGLTDAMAGDPEDEETDDEAASDDVTDSEVTDGDVADGEVTDGEAADEAAGDDVEKRAEAGASADEPDSDAAESAAESAQEAVEGSVESAVEEGEQSADVEDKPADEEGGTTDEGSVSSDPSDTPAFEFDDSSPKSIYVRDETLDLLEDAEFEVEMLLRREEGIRNVTGREFHDAAVRVLAEHADEIASEVVRLREADAE